MKTAMLFVWILLPLTAAGYHFGPGQDRLRHDDAAAAIARAEAAVTAAMGSDKAGDKSAARVQWAAADEAYSEAIALLSKDEVATSQRLRVERAKAQMFLSKLPEARRDLEGLIQEIAGEATADPTLLADAQDAFANARYYSTWLMRLEGAPREEWEPEIEGSRQTYRMLAEQARLKGDVAMAKRSEENLESAVRLGRMELGDLQGLPLPSQ